MARKAAKKTAQRSSAKRELIDTGSDSRYVKRAADGSFKESDDVARSQRSDRGKPARRTVTAGYGDQGDQPRASKRAAKKR